MARSKKEIIRSAMEKIIRAKFNRDSRFRAEVLGYNKETYEVRFFQGKIEILSEDIPRKQIENLDPEKQPLPEYWEKLFKNVESLLEKKPWRMYKRSGTG